jgi:hypothetical protein
MPPIAATLRFIIALFILKLAASEPNDLRAASRVESVLRSNAVVCPCFLALKIDATAFL